MAVDGVIPTPGETFVVTTGGSSVQVAPANPQGGVITNPYDASEALYVNPIDAAETTAHDRTFALQPGQSWGIIPGQTTPTTVNSASDGHQFSVYYLRPA